MNQPMTLDEILKQHHSTPPWIDCTALRAALLVWADARARQAAEQMRAAIAEEAREAGRGYLYPDEIEAVPLPGETKQQMQFSTYRCAQCGKEVQATVDPVEGKLFYCIDCYRVLTHGKLQRFERAYSAYKVEPILGYFVDKPKED